MSAGDCAREPNPARVKRCLGSLPALASRIGQLLAL